MAIAPGLEPGTSGLGNQRSVQLSYATMCEKCERLADQRDGYMRRMERAIKDETEMRAAHAQMLEDVETLEGDRETLMTMNAELLARAERAERLVRRWRLRRDSNSRPAR